MKPWTYVWIRVLRTIQTYLTIFEQMCNFVWENMKIKLHARKIKFLKKRKGICDLWRRLKYVKDSFRLSVEL